MTRPFVLLSACLLAPLAAAQPSTGGLRLFLDCQNVYCDFDYFRTEIPFVDHVRNRESSDVHVIVTEQENGSGGDTYTLRFIGQGRFAGVEDALEVATSQTDTGDEQRAALVQAVRAGLVRYLARTPGLARLTFTYRAPPAGAAATTPPRDPWNYWVFRANLRGRFQGEQRYNSASLNTSVSAQRTTEAWKTENRLYYNLDRDAFELDDSTETVSRSRSYGANTLVVRSLGPHLSVGGRVQAYASDYSNTDLSGRVAPAIEYSLFPYSESTRRAARLLYTAGVTAVDYQQQTIYFKTSDVLFEHTLEASVGYQQPWGSLHFSLSGAQYLHDLSRYRVGLFGSLDLRLVRGLSLNLFGDVSRIRNQIDLPAGGATTDEVLLRRRQLGTSYRYFVSAGLSYTFGSIFNNVVNPRFD